MIFFISVVFRNYPDSLSNLDVTIPNLNVTLVLVIVLFKY